MKKPVNETYVMLWNFGTKENPIKTFDDEWCDISKDIKVRNKYILSRDNVSRLRGYDPKLDELKGFKWFKRWLKRPRLNIIHFKEGNEKAYTRDAFINDLGSMKVDILIGNVTYTMTGETNNSPALIKALILSKDMETSMNTLDDETGAKKKKRTKWFIIGLVIVIIVIVTFLFSSGFFKSPGVG